MKTDKMSLWRKTEGKEFEEILIQCFHLRMNKNTVFSAVHWPFCASTSLL